MGDFFGQIKTLFNRTKDNNANGGKEPSKKESVANFSMNEGDHGKIFGVSRKVVSAITIIIITIFAIAFITATSGPDQQQQQRAGIDPDKEKPASDGTNTVTGLPQNYSNYLNNQNFQRAEQQHGGNRQQTQQTSQEDARRRQQEQEARQRAEREAAALAQVNQPSAAQRAINAPNYLAQQQAQYAAQLRALEAAQNGQPPATAPISRKNEAIEFSLSGDRQAQAQAQASPDGTSAITTQVMQTSASTGSPYRMSAIAPTENTVQAGTVIPAVLCTGINSNVDGVVTAVLSYDTYDSLTGNSILIPAGTKLLGTYDGKAASESGRVKIEFNQMIFPNGMSYAINPQTFLAMDGAGYSGVQGKVDHHTDRSLSAGALGAGIAALGSIAAGNTSNTSNTYSAGQLAMQGAMAKILDATSSLFTKSANVKDTVSVKPGHSFMIYVASPVQF